jgi:transaldolase
MSVAVKQMEDMVHQIAYKKLEKVESAFYKSEALLAKLKGLGTEVWVDTGDLDLARSIWKSEFTALTTNNTLANQVVQSGVMDSVIKETIQKIRSSSFNMTPEELIMEIGFVINCRIALRLVEAFQVKVSVELHPAMSKDIEKSVAYGRRYFKVCPEYFIIKIPLTPEGYLAARKLRQEGIPINFTLGFSARQNYLAGRLSNPDYTNVFLGRLNAVVSDNAMGSGKFVGEKVTFATQQSLRKLQKKIPSTRTRLIGASVRNGEQVACLAGLDILTIPPSAIKQYLESGRPTNDIVNNVDMALTPEIDSAHPISSRFPKLWEVTDAFEKHMDELMSQRNLDEFNGEDLVRFCETRGIDLFHRFTASEQKKIYDDGKIPKLKDWSDKVALDDLMTQSALQSFAKDQNALDDRIRSFF